MGMQGLSIVRKGRMPAVPEPEEVLLPQDRLIVQASPSMIDIIDGLEGLQPVEEAPSARLTDLESQEVGLIEVMLSPHTNIAKKTLRQTRFRDKYDLTVLAIWREGRATVSEICDLPLRLGDALLVHGQRNKFSLVVFLVLMIAIPLFWPLLP